MFGFKKNSFLEGFGSIFNISGNHNFSKRFLKGDVVSDMQQDWRAVGQDWRVVGDCIRDAMSNFSSKQK